MQPRAEGQAVDPERKEGRIVKKPEVILPLIVIVNACLWGFTILMVSHTLRGTGAYQEIQHLLGAGAGASTVIVGGGIGGLMVSLKARKRVPTHGDDR